MPTPLALSTTKGFDTEFTKLIAKPGYTHQQAFDELNEIFEAATGEPKYSDYNSYRNARRRRMKG